MSRRLTIALSACVALAPAAFVARADADEAPPTVAPVTPSPANQNPSPANPNPANPNPANPNPANPNPPADSTAVAPDSPSDDLGDQLLGAELGLASGGRVTPGGLRIAGHYLYQLSERDWFDGGITFTFGGGSAACFRDRSDALICEHGFADGDGVELSATVRHYWPAQGKFRPFARAGVGIGLVHFSADQLSGLAIPLHGGGGVRAIVAPSIAVVAQADLALGFGLFDRGLGAEPQVGLAVTAGVEFSLK